ncbi:MAG: type IV pilus modification PilV family protein [Bacillota bacterium]|jgi:hypothetical protein
MGNQKGYLLLEIIVSLFIITLVLIPFLGLLMNGAIYYSSAGETTMLVNLAQAQMELLLDTPFPGMISTEGFQTCSIHDDYEYVANVSFYELSNLKKIILEVRARDNPAKKMRLVTLWADQ